ncbi:MAG: hypothetical protein ABR541_09525 [Candidatus Dormibacteria bacterium]
MGPRHRILYDVERWRRYRVLLLFPALALLVVIALDVRGGRPSSGSLYPLAAAFLFSLLLSSWLRQHFGYLRVEGEDLVVHGLATRARVPLSSVRRARVMRLGGAFERPERKRHMPRPARRWAEKDALALRLGAGVDMRRLRRLVGPKCVMDDELVVPVVDSRALLAELGGARNERPRERAERSHERPAGANRRRKRRR